MSTPKIAQADRDLDPFVVLPAAGGLELHLLPTRKYRTVLMLWVLECPLDERCSARALLPDLLLRGTAKSPGLADFTARCEELYSTDLVGSVTAVGTRQVIKFGLETISDRDAGGEPLLEQASGLLAEALHDPPLVEGHFRSDHFEQERTNLVRSIEAIADDKSLYAHRRLMETMHAGTPYALHPRGTALQAQALEESLVREAWGDVVRRAPGRVFMVGDVTEAQALAAVERLVAGDLPAADRPSSMPVGSAPEVPSRPVQEIVEQQALAQSKLVMGFRTLPEVASGAAWPLFGVVFGGGSHSRLFKRVREQEQ